jgi:hypothetical protein
VTFALDDGVGFVHIAAMDESDGSSQLSDVAAFRRFREGLDDRLVAPAAFDHLRRVGSYRVFGA